MGNENVLIVVFHRLVHQVISHTIVQITAQDSGSAYNFLWPNCLVALNDRQLSIYLILSLSQIKD